MKKILLSWFFAASFLSIVNSKAYAQETSDNLTYYYNNFASATAGTISSLGASGVGNATRPTGGTSVTIDASTTSPLEGTVSLESKSLSAIGAIRWDFLGSGGTGVNMAVNDLEWNFVYKNTTTSANDDPDVMTAGNNSWRYWLIGNSTYAVNNMQGIYVSHVGTNLVLRYRYDNVAGSGRYNSLLSTALPNDQNAYMIKVQRLRSGSWAIYMDLYVAGMTTAKTLVTISTGTTGSGLSTYNYSYLETTSTTTRRFQWDKFDMYTRVLAFVGTGANSASNGITPVPYTQDQTVIFYGLQVQSRGNFAFGSQMYLSATSSFGLNDYFNTTGGMYKSYDSFYSTTSDRQVSTTALDQGAPNRIYANSLVDTVSTSGNTDGTLSTPQYYFFTGTTKSVLNYGNPPTGTFSVTGVAIVYEQPTNSPTSLPFTNTSATSGTISFVNSADWNGNTSSAWNVSSNWSTGSVPTASTPVRIGVVTFNNQPIVSVPAVGYYMILGTTKATTLTVNSTLTISGTITQNLSSSTTAYTNTFTGTGTINCTNVQVGDNSNGGVSGQALVYSSVDKLNVSDDITITSNGTNRAAFAIHDGDVTVGDKIIITNSGTPSIANSAYFTINTANTGTNPTLTLNSVDPISIQNAVYGSVNFYGTTGGPTTTTYTAANANIYTATTTGGFGSASGTTTNPIDLTKATYYNLIVIGVGSKIGKSAGTLLIVNDLTTPGTVDAFTYANPITVGGAFTNTGTFTGGASTISAGSLYSSGTFTVASGALTVSGLTTLTGGTFTTGAGLFTTTGGINSTSATFQQGSGNVTMTGSVTQNSGTMNFSAGTVTVGTNIQIVGGTMNAGTGTTTVAGTFSNAGTYVGSTGTLDVNGSSFTNTGTLTLAGGTTNIACTTFSNTNPGTFIASAGTVNFDRANAQAIDNTNTTTPVAFYNVTFSAGNTKTLGATGTGTFTVAPLGILTMAASTTLAGGTLKMTLLSTASGSAAVDVVPSTAAITGTFNVQRFFTGGLSAANRGYRMMSSPVNQTSATLANTNTFNLNYIKTGAFTGGTGGTGNGFSGTSVGPTLYLYKETIAANNITTSFTSGKHVGIIRVGATDVQTLHSVDGTATIPSVTIPIGNGFLFYFVGNASRTTGSALIGGPPQDATITAPGYLNQGTFNVRLWHRADAFLSYAAADAAARGFCMVGNPYASTINLNTVLTDNATANGISAIYVLNSRKGGTAQNYISYTNLGNSSPLLQGYAVSGGGFIVKAKAATSFLTFKESQKVASTQLTGSGLIMSAPKADELAGGRQHAVMAIPSQSSAPAISGLYMKMEKDPDIYEYTGIYFRAGYESKYDQNDALYLAPLTNTVGMASLSSDGKKAAVNVMPDYHQGSRVKLHVYASTTGLYQLKLEGVRNIDEFYDIYLLDHFKKDSLDIRRYGVYNFNLVATDTATFGGNRFELVIRHKPVPQYLLTNISGAKITEGVNVTWKTANESNYTGFTLEKLSKSTSAYEPVYEKQSDGSAAYSYVDRAPVSGINTYRLKQNDIDGRISYSEPITVFYDKLAGNGLINVFPNPTVEVINVSIPSTMSSPSYKLRVFNSAGNLVLQKTSANRYWTEGVTQLKTGVYIIEVQKKDGTSLGKVKFVKN
nr:T9SS type A sorting domain-containing protein [uncultured Mucilaginibacter sp.]